MDKKWSDRLDKEDKNVLSKDETLNSVVKRLSREVVNFKERKMESTASTVATSSESRGSTIGYGIPSAQSGFLPSRVEPKGWGVWSDIRGTGSTAD